MKSLYDSFMAMKILKFPDPILKQVAQSIDLSDGITPKIKDLILEMKHTMEVYNGVGLAAPQVGESVRLIVCSLSCGVITMINPQIELIDDASPEAKVNGAGRLFEMTNEVNEGCLSLQGVYSKVKRYKKIDVQWVDENGVTQKQRFFNKDSVIIQHEIDHLDGKVFIDRVGAARTMLLQKYFKKAR